MDKIASAVTPFLEKGLSNVKPFIENGINAVEKLEPFFEKSVVFKPQLIQTAVKELADKTGQAPDTLLYILLMFAAYPLALFVGVLPSKLARHLSFGLGGIAMMQVMFGSQWIHSFITTMVTYIMVVALPRNIMPLSVFVFIMSYMCIAHLYRMYTDYMGWSLDFTGPQMILCIKLTSFAYNYYDGKIGTPRMEKKLLDMKEKGKSDPRAVSGLEKVIASQKKYAITSLPSLVEYLGYIYCFTTIMAGPAFEYADYASAVDGSVFKRKGSNQTSPGTVLPALARLGTGLLCMVLFVVGSGQFPLGVIADDSFLKQNMLYCYAYTWVALLFVRCKYYFAWKVAEGSCIMAGFGFEGYKEDGTIEGWNGVSNMDILGFELSGCVSQNSRAWNKRTQGWLERYVYNRTNRSLFAVYFVSAIWHGFYPGYYLFFLSVPLFTEAARVTKSNLRPYFGEEGGFLATIYKLFAMVLTSIHINYLVTSFQLLSWDASIKYWRNFFFMGHATLLVMYILCAGIPVKRQGRSKAD